MKASIKVSELKELLSKYTDETELNFYLIPNDGSEEDRDRNDIELNFVGEIYIGGIDNDEPFVDLGFQEPKEQPLKIIEDYYYTAKDFIDKNNLNSRVEKYLEFNKESESEIKEMQKLFKFLGLRHHKVEIIDGVCNGKDIRVWFDNSEFQMEEYKKSVTKMFNELLKK